MANTITSGVGGVNIVLDGSTAWNSTTLFPHGLILNSISFVPTAQNDIAKVRCNGASSRIMFDVKASDAFDSRIKYFDKSQELYKPYIVGDEASAGVTVIIDTDTDVA